MHSRLRRIVALIFTYAFLPTLARLFILLFVGYVVFIDGGMQFAAFKQSQTVVLDENGQIENIVLPISHAITARLFISLCIFCLALFYLVKDIFRIYSEYKNKKDIQIRSVNFFLENYKTKNKKYILVLRPFGVDGNLYLPIKRSFWSRFFRPGKRTITVEQIVQSQTQKVFGVETVSLIDPDRDILSPGPQYVAASSNWESEVISMIRQATGVVFVFPPKCSFSSGVKWEFEQMYDMAELSKAVAVFPPKQDKTISHKKILRYIFDYLPAGLYDVNEDLEDVFLLNFGSDNAVWQETYNNLLTLMIGEAHSDIYEIAIIDWLDDLNINSNNTAQYSVAM